MDPDRSDSGITDPRTLPPIQAKIAEFAIGEVEEELLVGLGAALGDAAPELVLFEQFLANTAFQDRDGAAHGGGGLRWGKRITLL